MQVIFHDNSIKEAAIAIYIGTSNTHLQHKKMFFFEPTKLKLTYNTFLLRWKYNCHDIKQ